MVNEYDTWNHCIVPIKTDINERVFENIHYTKENVNTKKSKKETISKETIKQIVKANDLDTQLYEWAKENFENRLKTLDRKSKMELETWTKSV
ncbi:hypothetical protein QFZ77_006755 [Paenibacillus sp. V4I3]|nr:hypothetical protein [Paenibacillus sp. V4I3]MDQ0886081.1 hypothetical protein [Paenibacillus sp. V4I9]